MSLTIGFIILVIIALLFYFIRRNQAVPDQRPVDQRPAKKSPSTEFHAVSIKFASSACDAAKALEGKRFLSTAAPRIPLPECDVLECKCRFVHRRRRGDGYAS